MEFFDITVDPVRWRICEDRHVANEINEEKGSLTSCREGECCELRGDHNRDDVAEKDRSEAIEEEYNEEVARVVPSGGSLGWRSATISCIQYLKKKFLAYPDKYSSNNSGYNNYEAKVED